MLGRVGVGAGGQPDVVGLVGAAGEDLVPVDGPFVPVQHGPGAQRGQVGAGTGLGVADGEVDLAGQDPRQEEALLLVGPEPHDHRAHGVEGDEGERGPGPLHLGEEDELVRGRAALAPELLGPADAQPPVLAHTPDQRPEHLAALGLGVEGLADVVGEQLGEVGPELLPEGQLLRSLFEVHDV